MTTWPELETLKTLTGQAYLDFRTKLLKTPDLPALLARSGAPDGWNDQVHVAILRGWLEHRLLYEQVLRELDAVDVEFESKKVSGISGVWTKFADKARLDWKKPVLPLCWEALIKYQRVVAPWKQIAFLRMTGVLPDEMSVEPVIAFMRMSPDAGSVDLAGRVLETLPKGVVKRVVEQHLEAAEPPIPGTVRSVLTRVLDHLKS